MDAYVEPHLTWRFLEPGDAAEVEEFRQQLDALDNSVLSGLASAITDSELYIGQDMAVGGWDAYHSLSAFGVSYLADTDPVRIYLMGGVHPVHRHQAIGTALFRWQVDRAIAWRDEHRPGQQLWLGCYSDMSRPGTQKVASHFGFTTERFYYDLQRDLTEPVRLHHVDGLTFAPLDVSMTDEVRVLHNHCFALMGGRDVTDVDWRGRLDEESFRYAWSVVALDGDRVVGYAMSGLDEGGEGDAPAGWTERFGVHPEYRGRGVALGMLSRCLQAMADSGCTEAGIGIDTADGAGIERFTGELGYDIRDAVALLSRLVD
ncbi:GNAT family N-acetyltransferase [Tessaracoccus massiliensis]|uniref:GNAT family N-acetyltransferase n=1 Tax=Tessaracoccus massiliensis TaxID=1522311 RepID=UPI00058AC113|nr:GNAT family N-acetyltransferase [Tessaracoccus massiliensis]